MIDNHLPRSAPYNKKDRIWGDPILPFLAALLALYLPLTLSTHSLADRHFRILTQRTTLETWDYSDIWSEWCLDEKPKRQIDKRRIDKQRVNLLMSGQFRNIAFLFFCSIIPSKLCWISKTPELCNILSDLRPCLLKWCILCNPRKKSCRKWKLLPFLSFSLLQQLLSRKSRLSQHLTCQFSVN